MYRRSILPVSGAEKWPKLIFWEPATFSRKTGHAEVELYDRDVSSYFLLLSGCSLVWMAPFFYLFKIIGQIQISMKQTLGPNIHSWKQHLYHFRLQKYKSVFIMYLHLFRSMVRMPVDCGYQKVLRKLFSSPTKLAHWPINHFVILSERSPS